MHSWTTLSHVLAKNIAKLFGSELRNDEAQRFSKMECSIAFAFWLIYHSSKNIT